MVIFCKFFRKAKKKCIEFYAFNHLIFKQKNTFNELLFKWNVLTLKNNLNELKIVIIPMKKKNIKKKNYKKNFFIFFFLNIKIFRSWTLTSSLYNYMDYNFFSSLYLTFPFNKNGLKGFLSESISTLNITPNVLPNQTIKSKLIKKDYYSFSPILFI